MTTTTSTVKLTIQSFEQSIRKQSEKKTYPKICQGQISRMLRRHLCVVTFARENSDCFLTTSVAQTSVSHSSSIIGPRQSEGAAAEKKSFFTQQLFQSFKNSTLQSIFHCFASSPKSIFRSRPLFWKLSKEMTFFALYHTTSTYIVSAPFWGGLKNTTTAYLRPEA